MKTKRCFNTMQEMECIAGDTLPPFTVTVKNEGTPVSVSGLTMKLIVAEMDRPAVEKKVKECTAADGKFTVTLTSEDTVGWDGDYGLHFALCSGDGLVYRKLAGVLHVHPAPKGGV